ncbi:WW domain-binding protein 4-like [Xyrauchen texanus]|uniref:WW domain-binding protein 4-like n=1 Tax=Xyrauchen texanus TaxID=154827 RepID=UPI002241C336|nr:WW domain-binding protein 4-like [Xyrauchen texanus]
MAAVNKKRHNSSTLQYCTVRTQTCLFGTQKRKEPTADDGGEEQADEGGREEEEEEEEESDRCVTEEHVTLVKKPRQNISPYGFWEQNQPEEDPHENVDLQLLQVESAVAAVAAVAPSDVPPEPRTQFKERPVPSLGDKSGAFKKMKTENGKSRSRRPRGKDE